MATSLESAIVGAPSKRVQVETERLDAAVYDLIQVVGQQDPQGPDGRGHRAQAAEAREAAAVVIRRLLSIEGLVEGIEELLNCPDADMMAEDAGALGRLYQRLTNPCDTSGPRFRFIEQAS